MIREYAVEPDAFLTSEVYFAYWIEKFGREEGRVISLYPKSWPRMVHDALLKAGFRTVERKRIKRRLEKLKTRGGTVRPRGRDYDGTKKWLVNVLATHEKQPFWAVLTRNPTEGDRMLCAAEVPDEDEPLLEAKRGLALPKDTKSIGPILEPLVLLARELIFVDPYFNPTNPLSRELIFELVGCTSRCPSGAPDLRICKGAKYPLALFRRKKELQRIFGPVLAPRQRLEVFEINELVGGDAVHDRYVLADVGGVILSYGLDERDRDRSGHRNNVNLLTEDQYREWWRAYSAAPSFHIVDSQTIAGK